MTGTQGTDGTLRHIAVVGASLAGVRAAHTLRARGYDGRLTLVDAGNDPPPDLDVELLLNTTAEGLDLTGTPGTPGHPAPTGARAPVPAPAPTGALRLPGGRTLDFDGLVVATGAGPRHPTGLRTGHPAVLVPRTSEDSPDLRAALAGGPRVAVVGAGFTGCEITSRCRALGLDVTLVESAAAPLARVLGTAMGRELAALHRDHGTALTTGATAVSLRPDGVVTADGTVVPADVVLIAAGRAPRTAWLRGSGLDIQDGVLLDPTCAAVGATRVVAAGTVARWCNQLFGEEMRVEHRSDAAEQAVAAAETLLADGVCAMPFESVPYFRSEQYGTEIQFVGRASRVPHVVAGTLAERRFVALYTDGQHITGALCVNSPTQLDRYRRMVAARVPVDVLLAQPAVLKSRVRPGT